MWCKWGVVGLVLFVGGAAALIYLDRQYKAELAMAADNHDTSSITIADNGYLRWRHSLSLRCTKNATVRMVAKMRLPERGRLKPGMVAAAELTLASTRTKEAIRPLYTAPMRVRLTSMTWVDTLESDALTAETMHGIEKAMTVPADVVFVDTMERDTIFEITARVADLRSFTHDCQPRAN
jgi:hypothetical protein